MLNFCELAGLDDSVFFAALPHRAYRMRAWRDGDRAPFYPEALALAALGKDAALRVVVRKDGVKLLYWTDCNIPVDSLTDPDIVDITLLPRIDWPNPRNVQWFGNVRLSCIRAE